MDVFGSDTEDSKAEDFQVERLNDSTVLGYYPGEEASIDISIGPEGEIYLREGADHEEHFDRFLDELDEFGISYDRESVEQAAEALDYEGERY